MEALGTMNILSALFGIFRQRGLVKTLQEGHSLVGFVISGILFSILGGVLYGFATGAGLGIETAMKDAVKVGLIVALAQLFSIPIFWVAYRLLGREERLAQIAAVPLTLAATVTIILAITAPVVFMLSVLVGFSQEAIYIHIAIVDLALLVGLYLAGVLVNYGFTERKRLIIPNVIGFLMMGIILVILMNFLGPFLSIRPTFSIGTDRLKDGLGIGVADKVNQALVAAAAADRVSYRFQTANENGDLTREYTVTRVGNDYLVEVNLHGVPDEIFQKDRRIWLLDGQIYTDFDEGKVAQSNSAELTSYLSPALPPAPFTLSDDFDSASWRAFESSGRYTASGTTQTLMQATLVLEADTGRLIALTLGSAGQSLSPEIRVTDIATTVLDRSGLEASLNQAIVLGDVDRSDAAMQDYVQEEAFFVVRYPRTWRVGTWNPGNRQVELNTNCGLDEGCPALTVSVFDLTEGKGPKQYSEDLGRSLGLLPEYREIKVSTASVDDETVGVVEYLFDRTVKGEIETTHHIEYIFVGQLSQYHLDFSAPAPQFDSNSELFDEISRLFTYLKVSP